MHIFRARHDRFPETLRELPGDRKAASPLSQDVRIDPFTGDYFDYQLTEDGPRIYSLSENGIDDGGIHSPNWDTEIDNGRKADRGAASPMPSRSDDHVFWPPQEDSAS